MKSFKERIRLASIVVAASTLFAVTACGSSGGESASGDESSSSGQTLKVGLLFSLTGAAGAFGTSEYNGAKVVLDDINAHGGINGVKIEYFTADDKTDPTEATQQVRKLVNEDKVQVIIGPTLGGNTLAVAPIAAQAQVPLLANNGTIAVTDPKQNPDWKWVFRTAPSDLVTAKAMLDQVLAEGLSKVAIFAEESAYGDGTLAYLTDLLKEQGLAPTTVARAAVTDTDFSAQATKIIASHPDVVLSLTSPAALAAGLVRALRAAGSDVPMWGPIGVAQQSFIDAAGEAGEGVHVMGMSNWTSPSAGEQQLGALLSAAGLKGTSFEVAGSNGAQALEAAVKTIQGDITGSKIRDALESVCGLDTYAPGAGVCYSPTNHDGYGTDSLVMLVVKDGKFEPYTP
jgi:branched-chain amino acid transport system substrate-binding protein